MAGETSHGANGIMATLRSTSAAHNASTVEDSFSLEEEGAAAAADSSQGAPEQSVHVDIWGPHWTGTA